MFYLFTTTHRNETKGLTPLLLGNWCLENSINEDENKIIWHNLDLNGSYTSEKVPCTKLSKKFLYLIFVGYKSFFGTFF